jgi:hypothetical protein
MSCLLEWDLSGLTALNSLTVVGATVTVDVVDPSTSSYSAQTILKHWTSAEVTWKRASNTQLWTVAGALYSSDRDPNALFSFPGSVGTHTSVVTSVGLGVIQNWISHPTSNMGVIVSGTDTHRMQLGTRELSVSRSAKLCVKFTRP